MFFCHLLDVDQCVENKVLGMSGNIFLCGVPILSTLFQYPRAVFRGFLRRHRSPADFVGGYLERRPGMRAKAVARCIGAGTIRIVHIYAMVRQDD